MLMKKVYKAFAIIMALILCLTLVNVSVAAVGNKAQAFMSEDSISRFQFEIRTATLSDHTFLYANKDKGLYEYTDIIGSTVCTIKSIDRDGWMIVEYNDRGGRKRTLYARTDNFFVGDTIRKGYVIRRAPISSGLGRSTIKSILDSGMPIYVVGEETDDGRYQIVYKDYYPGVDYYQTGCRQQI